MPYGDDEMESHLQLEQAAPKKVKSMDIYEELQNPELRLVLSNIPQFQDESQEGEVAVVSETVNLEKS